MASAKKPSLKEFSAEEQKTSAGQMAESAAYHLAMIASKFKRGSRKPLDEEKLAKLSIIDNYAEEIIDALD